MEHRDYAVNILPEIMRRNGKALFPVLANLEGEGRRGIGIGKRKIGAVYLGRAEEP